MRSEGRDKLAQVPKRKKMKKTPADKGQGLRFKFQETCKILDSEVSEPSRKRRLASFLKIQFGVLVARCLRHFSPFWDLVVPSASRLSCLTLIALLFPSFPLPFI